MAAKNQWEINCDLGEGVAHEAQLFPFIDAASVACGGHYGDENTVYQSLTLAKKFGVKAGIHPSYPDQVNFGRKSMQIPFSELETSLLDQIGLFKKVATGLEIQPDHLKFHGALYNDAAKDRNLASKLAALISEHLPDMVIFVPPFSEMEKAAKNHGLKTRLEIFGDRTYKENYQLLERNQPKALLTDPREVEIQLESILVQHQLISSIGTQLPIHAETICFHGDNPGILEFLPQIRRKFWQNQS